MKLVVKQLDKSELVPNLFLDLRISCCHVVWCFFFFLYLCWCLYDDSVANGEKSVIFKEITFAFIISIVVSTKSVTRLGVFF